MRQAQTIDVTSALLRRVRGHGRGWVFAPKDFSDLGSRAAVDQALSRLADKGAIRRLSRGIYDYPRHDPDIGVLSPRGDDLARAVAVGSGDIIFPSAAMGANLLGLSTQVSAKSVYLTNGKSRLKNVAGRSITLKHARTPVLPRLSSMANALIQALQYLGRKGIDDTVINACARQMSNDDLKMLVTASSLLPGWLSDTIHKIYKVKNNG